MSEALTAGKFPGRAIVENVQFGYTKNNIEQIAIPFVITQGPCIGQVRTWFGTFSDAGTEWCVKTLRACGWQGNDLNDLGPLDNEVQLVILEEEYEGRLQLRLKYVNPIGGGKVKLAEPMEQSDRADFARRMKGVIAGLSSGDAPAASARGRAAAPRTGYAAPAPRTPAREARDDVGFDEVPF